MPQPTPPAPPAAPPADASRSAAPRPAAARPAAPTVPRPVARPAAAPAPPAPVDGVADVWRKMFREWPRSIPRRGIVINSLNEALPFKGFMLSGDVVLLQRTNPDSLGARYLLVPFAEIALVKLTDPLGQEAFDSAGYEGKLA